MATRTSVILAFALQVTLSTSLQVGLNMGSKSGGDCSGRSSEGGGGLDVNTQIGGHAAGIKGGIGGSVGGSGSSFLEGGISKAGGMQAILDMGLGKDWGLNKQFKLGLSGSGGGVSGKASGGINIGGNGKSSGGDSLTGGGRIIGEGGLQGNILGDMGLGKHGFSSKLGLGGSGSGTGVSFEANGGDSSVGNSEASGRASGGGGFSVGGNRKSSGGDSLTEGGRIIGGGGFQGNILGDMGLGKHGLSSKLSLGGSGTGVSFEANGDVSSGGNSEASGRASGGGGFSVGGNGKYGGGVSLTEGSRIIGGGGLQGNILGDMGLGKHGLSSKLGLGGSVSGTGVSFEANGDVSSGGNSEASGRASGGGGFSVGGNGKYGGGVSLTKEGGNIGGDRLKGNTLGHMGLGNLNSGFSLGGSENGRMVSFEANSEAGSGAASGRASLSEEGGTSEFSLGGSGHDSGEAGTVGNMEISHQLGMSIDGNTGLKSQAEERGTDYGISSYSETNGKNSITSVENKNINRKSTSGKEENGGVGNANLRTSGGTGASFELGALGFGGGMDFGQLAAALGNSDGTLELNGLRGSVLGGSSGNFDYGVQGAGVPSMNENIDLNGLGSLTSSLGGTGGSLDVGVNGGSLGGSMKAGMNHLVPITSQVLSKAMQYGSIPMHFMSSGLSGAANAMGKFGSFGSPGANLHIGVPSKHFNVRQLIPQLSARMSGRAGGVGSAVSSTGVLGASGESGMSGSFDFGRGPRGGLRVIKASGNGLSGDGASGGINSRGGTAGMQVGTSPVGLNMGVPGMKFKSLSVSSGSTSSASNTSH